MYTKLKEALNSRHANVPVRRVERLGSPSLPDENAEDHTRNFYNIVALLETRYPQWQNKP